MLLVRWLYRQLPVEIGNEGLDFLGNRRHLLQVLGNPGLRHRQLLTQLGLAPLPLVQQTLNLVRQPSPTGQLKVGNLWKDTSDLLLQAQFLLVGIGQLELEPTQFGLVSPRVLAKGRNHAARVHYHSRM
ncbi:hypothetical protein C4K18_1513 [Pseudomonas chlororaphis subsp. aurantiaca]|nr:hypothetical protein C4K18_1513 [Pseudomonas chlororaphis subsp. aurantiaca]